MSAASTVRATAGRDLHRVKSVNAKIVWNPVCVDPAGHPLINQQNNVFIDPGNCGSSVGYYIVVDEYTPRDKPTEYPLAATVVLADCAHKIDWNFDGEGNLNKIDSAIAVLQEFRKKYIDAEKLVKRLNKK